MKPKGIAMKVYILLDRSQSMVVRWGEAIGAVNAYVTELAKAKETKGAEVTVATFDSVTGLMFEIIRDDVKASKFEPVTDKDATPRGGTPLYDAVGKLVNLIDAKAPKKAAVVIMTDGEENSSRELSREASKALLDKARAKGYSVVFLGADFDAIKQGAGLGNAHAHSLNTVAGSYALAASALASHTHTYAATGMVRSFTDAERTKAGGKSAA
jgi:uncharacterized protein with von Willebrand factor type A (vWA) domain